MDDFFANFITYLLLIPFIIIFIILPIGIGILFYRIPKKYGYPIIGKILTIIYGLLILTYLFFIIFEDQLFTKNNAKELLAKHQIYLNDNFELVHNKSMSSIGDYYHIFKLKISDNDHKNAVIKIKNAQNFKGYNSTLNEYHYKSLENEYNYKDRYFGPKIVLNYETEVSYVYDYFKPSGQKGYAPSHIIITIYKSKNEIKFEDIDP